MTLPYLKKLNNSIWLPSLLVSVLLLPGLAHSAKITGALFKSDGVTAVQGDGFEIELEGEDWDSYSSSVLADGTFEVNVNINAATTIYLRAEVHRHTDPSTNYIGEWWALPQSVRARSEAQGIYIENDSVVIPNINFQLEPGAIIEGTLFKSDGTTPLTGVPSNIEVYQGSCSSIEQLPYYGPLSRVDESTAMYQLLGLPAGTYRLKAIISNDDNYLDEWWGQSGSVRSCEEAHTITVETENTYTGKDYQIDAGGEISGTVIDQNSNPIEGGDIVLFQGDCSTRTFIRGEGFGSDTGDYSLNQLSTGSYKVQLTPSYYGNDFASEWWTASGTAYRCADADVVSVTEGQLTTAVDFQVGPGASWSGTIYKADGVTPITADDFDHGSSFGGGIDLFIMPSDLSDVCSISNDNIGRLSQRYYDLSQFEGTINNSGTYTINNIAPGSYYMFARPWGKLANVGGEIVSLDPPFEAEWWANPQSTLACSGAQMITVFSLVDNQSNVDFQLNSTTDQTSDDSICFPVKSAGGAMAIICL